MAACCVLGALLFGALFRALAALRGPARRDDDWERPVRPLDP